MNLQDAYNKGYETGQGIAEQNIQEFLNDPDSANEAEEFISDVCQTESEHYRQFSPFEFTAKEFNESPDPENTWERYEQGVADAASDVWHDHAKNEEDEGGEG